MIRKLISRGAVNSREYRFTNLLVFHDEQFCCCLITSVTTGNIHSGWHTHYELHPTVLRPPVRCRQLGYIRDITLRVTAHARLSATHSFHLIFRFFWCKNNRNCTLSLSLNAFAVHMCSSTFHRSILWSQLFQFYVVLLLECVFLTKFNADSDSMFPRIFV